VDCRDELLVPQAFRKRVDVVARGNRFHNPIVDARQLTSNVISVHLQAFLAFNPRLINSRIALLTALASGSLAFSFEVIVNIFDAIRPLPGFKPIVYEAKSFAQTHEPRVSAQLTEGGVKKQIRPVGVESDGIVLIAGR